MKKIPDITNNFSEWYQEIVYKAELADIAPVRGCMVIRPYGYKIWELIQKRLDDRIKETGHLNASFPLFIPESFIKREAEHIEGFAPELAIVTHAGGKKLEEPLVVRPTSETIIHYMFARWIKSWRDLPMKINQWANVVRWEKRPRVFLRTTEFFWQEGHTAHEKKDEAETHAKCMLQEYVDFAHDYLAIPVISGLKSEREKFPGAVKTYTFEGIMPDGKALQMGTSHVLSHSFAETFNISYQDRMGKQAYPYLTSWGVTTRFIGAIIMVHGDQKGLILPPMIAPIQVVIIPILKKQDDNNAIIYNKIADIKRSLSFIRVHVDENKHKTPGAKFNYWELKGVPLRLEIGLRDIEENKIVACDRVEGKRVSVSFDKIGEFVTDKLKTLQKKLLISATKRRNALIKKSDKLSLFGDALANEKNAYQVGWCQSSLCEEKLKKYKGSIRCLLASQEASFCFYCDKKSRVDILVAKSY
jgi:prolyl-tRNA synthetase